MTKTAKSLLILLIFFVAVSAGLLTAWFFSQPEINNNVSGENTSGVNQKNNSLQTKPIKKYTAGETFSTYIEGETGKIAVSVLLPAKERYSSGAPVVIYVPVFFSSNVTNFDYLEGLSDQGIIQVTLMYPGQRDKFGVQSEGEEDYGGANSIKALRDTILFAAGEKENLEGYSLDELIEIKVDFNNVGLYAFSHPGIIATNVMALYGEQLMAVDYLVGRENPTMDILNSLEIGHYNEEGNKKEIVLNPVYSYTKDYSPTNISLDYSSIKWSKDLDVPYFDLNNNNQPDDYDYVQGKQVPQLFGKRVYSDELLLALSQNGLTATVWPKDLATPEEAKEWWSDNRETINSYSKLKNESLKIMLVFSLADHVQTALDKPHIHQAFDGFHETAGLWTRLNPDAVYVENLNSEIIKNYSEHEANKEPNDWSEIGLWAYPSKGAAMGVVPIAAVIEMADRTHVNNWERDLLVTIK